MASINSLMRTETATEYYDPQFRICIEDHLTYLRKTENIDVITFDNGVAYKYEHDFNGLLLHLGIEKELHWVVMRINGYLSSMEYAGDVNFVDVPKISIINALRTTWAATYV